MDLNLRFESDLKIDIKAGFLTSQIINLDFKTKVRISADLLSNVYPFISAVRIQFLQTTFLDVIVKPISNLPLDIFEQPGVFLIKRFIISQLYALMGYPKFYEIDIIKTLNLPATPVPRKRPTKPLSKEFQIFRSISAGIASVGEFGLDATKAIGSGLLKVGELGVDTTMAVGKGVIKVGELGVDATMAVGHGVVKVGELGVDATKAVGHGVVKVGEVGFGAVKGVGKGVAKVGDFFGSSLKKSSKKSDEKDS